MEIGYLQGTSVYHLFEKAFPEAKIEIWKDMAGQDRVVYVTT